MPNLGAINWSYGGDINAPDPATPQSPSPSQMYGYLLSRGASPNEAHMLTGAAASESELDPSASHDKGIGYGMFGHNGSRLLAMKQYASTSGQPLSDWRTQAAFALQELRSRPEALAVQRATTPEQLALAEMHYEQPQGFTAGNPEAGHNYTGRLNTLKMFTKLNPDATGAFAPDANPQITPQQLFGAGVEAPSTGSSPTRPYVSPVGNPAVNAIAAQLVAGLTNKPQTSGDVPLVSYLVGRATQPLFGALGNLLSGRANGDTSSFGAPPSPSTPAPPSSSPTATGSAPQAQAAAPGSAQPAGPPPFFAAGPPPASPIVQPSIGAASPVPTMAQGGTGIFDAIKGLVPA